MILGLPPYAAIRESGLPWVPHIPSHWGVRRNGGLFSQRVETGFPDLPILEVSLRTGVRVRDMENIKRKQVMGLREKYKRAAKGDIAYNMMRMWQGALGTAPVDGLISPAYVVARPFAGINSAYYSYLYRIDAYLREVNKFSRGIVADRNRLYWVGFKQMPALLPPREEQDQIVAYLRAQDVQIARFIRDKRRLIELLNEQKQTLIHRAVTRGLDPHVRLKSSGMEWLGEVPEHWSVIPLKAAAVVAFSGVDKLTEEGESPVLLCNYTDVYRNDQITSNLMFMKATATPHEIARFTLRKGDVLMTKDSETPDDIGVPAWVSEELHGVVCGYHLALLRPRPAIAVGAFLYRALCSPHVASQFHVAAAGVTRFGLAKRDIQTAVLAVPPVAEQVNIVKWLERETVELDKVISGAKAEIDLMREYRDRLIADVVTGQIDVRSWVPGPDDQIDDSEVTLEIEAEEAMDEQGDNNDDDGHE